MNELCTKVTECFAWISRPRERSDSHIAGGNDITSSQPLKKRSGYKSVEISTSHMSQELNVADEPTAGVYENGRAKTTTLESQDEFVLKEMMVRRLREHHQPVYIPPMAKANLQAPDEDIFPLMENVQEFLTSNRQVMLILGDSGAGKSTFNKHLEAELLQSYNSGDRIPLFVNLPALGGPATDIITEQLREHNFSEDQIQDLKQHRQFLVICDGYDESQLTFNLHTSNNFNRPGQWSVKLIISCRTQYLSQDYRNHFVPQEGHSNASASTLFREAVISPFSNVQIRDYVEQYVPLQPRTWKSQDYMERLTIIPNLMDLVRNPFLLFLALEALPTFIEREQNLSTVKISRIQLYDTFVVHWLNVNKRRLESNALSVDERVVYDQLLDAGFILMGIDYSTRLATSIFEKQDGNPVVQYGHTQDDQSWQAEFFGPDPVVRLLRESAPLTRTGSLYRFLHQSMLEYFFSCAIFDPSGFLGHHEFAPHLYTDSPNTQWLGSDSPLFTRNLVTEQSIIQFLSERVQQTPAFKEQLSVVIELSKTDASAATAAANAITILVKAGVTFHGQDLRGIRIPSADISGGQFDSVRLQGSDLTGVNLGWSWLRQSDFSKAQMKGVQFGELPYLEENASVWTCRYSPDGRMLAVGMDSGGLTLYDTEAWKKIRSLVGHDGDIESLAFSPDGKRLASGGDDRAVRVWESGSGGLLWTMDGHTHTVRSVAFSPCGKKIASASSDDTLRLWNSFTGEALLIFEGHTQGVSCVKFTPDGRHIVSGSWDGTIRFWNVDAGVPGHIWNQGYGQVICMDISPDGFKIVSGHPEGTLRLWNIISGSPGSILRGHTDNVMSVMFSSDGQRIASASDDSTVRVWDPSSGTQTSMFSSRGSLLDVSISPDGSTLVSVDGSKMIQLWDMSSSGSSIGSPGHSESVTAVAYLPTGDSIMSSGQDKTVRQWDAFTGAAGFTRHFSNDFMYSVALSPNFRQAASCKEVTIQLWDLSTGERGPTLDGHTDNVTGLTYSPCGRWLSSISLDKTARLWDLQNAEEGHVLCERGAETEGESGHNYVDYFALAFSPTGIHLAVGNVKETVVVYDTQTRVLLKNLTLEGECVSALAYSPNGEELAIGVEGFIFFWDLQSKEPSHKLEVHVYDVFCIAYSPCERWIAFSDDENWTVHLCRRHSRNIDAWRHVFVVEGSLDFINDIAWNPAVPLEFVTGCRDRSVRVWRISENNSDCGDGSAVSVDLIWGSNIGVLGVSGMRLEGVVGLDALSRRLLKQRGAIDDSLACAEVGLGSSAKGEIGEEERPERCGGLVEVCEDLDVDRG